MLGARKTMLSAVKPTNDPTLGNYLGAIRNWVRLQAEYDCVFFAVDLHAITVRLPPEELRRNTLLGIASYIACGIDPGKSLLFAQSHVPEHAELSWILTCFANMGELSRMTQYKDKAQKEDASIGAGIFSYPVLMAADIFLYDTDLVPVGEDQKQHVELSRDLAQRMNQLFGPLFKVPEPYIPPVGARIMSLQNPTKKMAKSDDDPNGAVYLTDSDDAIARKIKRAVTDSGTEIAYDPDKPGVSNLLTIQSSITGKPVADLVAAYAGKQYGHLKVETADLVVATLGPIRERIQRLLGDEAYLSRVLREGAEKARSRAGAKMRLVHDRIGFVPGRYP